jgi:hypothetical protein
LAEAADRRFFFSALLLRNGDTLLGGVKITILRRPQYGSVLWVPVSPPNYKIQETVSITVAAFEMTMTPARI